MGNGRVFTANGVALAPRRHAAQALACEHFVLRKKRIANAVGCQHGVERAHCPYKFEYVEKITLKHVGQHRIGARKLHVFRYFGHKAGQQGLALGHALLRQNLVNALCRSRQAGRARNGPACGFQHVFLHTFFRPRHPSATLQQKSAQRHNPSSDAAAARIRLAGEHVFGKAQHGAVVDILRKARAVFVKLVADGVEVVGKTQRRCGNDAWAGFALHDRAHQRRRGRIARAPHNRAWHFNTC